MVSVLIMRLDIHDSLSNNIYIPCYEASQAKEQFGRGYAVERECLEDDVSGGPDVLVQDEIFCVSRV